MDLIVSVFMTDIGASFRVTKRNERLNVFKYTLESYSVLPINKAFIFCKLDTNYEKYKEEFEIFVHSIFKNCVLHFDRFSNQREWIEYDIINKLESDLIWFNQNDDHVFIDSNLDMVLEGIEHLNNETSKYKSLHYTHFPEQLNVANKVGFIKVGNYLKFNVPRPDSTQIFNKEYLKHLLYEIDWKNKKTHRIDDLIMDKRICGDYFKEYKSEIFNMDLYTYIPLKELVRHFEAYHPSKSPYNICPPLFIPPGFFENNIIIKFCNKVYDRDCVNIHPFKKIQIPNKYNYVNKDEINILTDLNCHLLSDIPLVWKKHIKKIIIDEIIPEDQLKNKRNENLYEFYNLPAYNMITDYKIMSKINNNYPNDWYIYNIKY